MVTRRRRFSVVRRELALTRTCRLDTTPTSWLAQPALWRQKLTLATRYSLLKRLFLSFVGAGWVVRCSDQTNQSRKFDGKGGSMPFHSCLAALSVGGGAFCPVSTTKTIYMLWESKNKKAFRKAPKFTLHWVDKVRRCRGSVGSKEKEN